MDLRSYHRRIIGDERNGTSSALLAGLDVLERVYRVAIDRRNRRFDRNGPQYRPPVPLISVGNLTVGGTGKTPLVIELVQRLLGEGRRPCVVSRGYGASDLFPSDEELLIRRHCPGVPCVCDPDRIAACRAVLGLFHADAVVLDDGFQRRDVARDWDVVLVDATCPFGYDHLLPRGLLREPVASLRRADTIVLTRCDQVPASDLSMIRRRLGEVSPDAAVLRCRHRVMGFERVDGTMIGESPSGARAVLMTAIGNPASFEKTAASLGVEIVSRVFRGDHYRYRRTDVEDVLQRVRCGACDLVLTSEKDAVKLAALGGYERAPIAVVRVAIDFVEGDGTLFDRKLSAVMGPGRS